MTPALNGCGSRRKLRGLRRRSIRLGFVIAALAQARLFANTSAQVEELRASHPAMPDYLNFIQPGRVGNKGALDANAVRRKASYGDALGRAVAAQTHNHALEWLQTLAVAFDNAIQHADCIP